MCSQRLYENAAPRSRESILDGSETVHPSGVKNENSVDKNVGGGEKGREKSLLVEGFTQILIGR